MGVAASSSVCACVLPSFLRASLRASLLRALLRASLLCPRVRRACMRARLEWVVVTGASGGVAAWQEHGRRGVRAGARAGDRASGGAIGGRESRLEGGRAGWRAGEQAGGRRGECMGGGAAQCMCGRCAGFRGFVGRPSVHCASLFRASLLVVLACCVWVSVRARSLGVRTDERAAACAVASA